MFDVESEIDFRETRAEKLELKSSASILNDEEIGPAYIKLDRDGLTKLNDRKPLDPSFLPKIDLRALER